MRVVFSWRSSWEIDLLLYRDAVLHCPVVGSKERRMSIYISYEAVGGRGSRSAQ